MLACAQTVSSLLHSPTAQPVDGFTPAGGSFHLSCAMKACSLPDMSQPNRCKSPLRLPSQVTIVYVKLTVQMNQWH